MKRDLIIIILGILLVLAMFLTILYGTERGRHGYGASLNMFAGSNSA